MKKSTKVSRRKVVQAVKAQSYGTAISLNRNLISNNYGPKVKAYGPHRKSIADAMRQARRMKRGRGIAPTSKALRGIESVR